MCSFKSDIYTYKVNVWVLIASFCAVFVVCFKFVSYEDNVYSWDYAGYHQFFAHYGGLLSNGVEFFRQIAQSMKGEYNALPVAMLSPLFNVFGGGRHAYISSISCVYMFAVFGIMFFHHTASTPVIKKYYALSAVSFAFFIFLFTPFWFPTLRGYPDVGGLIPLSLAYFMATRTDLAKVNIRQMVCLGILLYMAFVFRRWYAYAVFALCFSYIVMSVVFSKGNISASIRIVINMCIVTFVFVCLALLLQYEFFTGILRQNYHDAYSGYGVSLIQDLLNIYERVPLVYLLMFFAFLVVTLFHALNNRCHVDSSLREAVFLALFVCVYFFSFHSIQGLGIQHFLPLAFAILQGACLCFGCVLRQRKWIQPLVLFVIIGPLLLNFCNSLFVLEKNFFAEMLTQRQRCFPLKHENISELERLENDLKKVLTSDAKNAKAVVFSSSGLLNDHILVYRSPWIAQKMQGTSQVDKRDGIPVAALLAKYAVVASPVQFHLPAHEQQVVSVPAEKILKKEGIGNAYSKILGPYDFGTGVQVFVYEKMRHFSIDEVNDYFKSFSADFRLWRNPPTYQDALYLLTRSVSLGDVFGTFEKRGEQFFIHTGATMPTEIIVNSEKLGTVEIQAHVPQNALEHCPKTGGDVMLTVQGDGKKITERIIAGQKKNFLLPASGQISIIADPNGPAHCDWVFLNIAPEAGVLEKVFGDVCAPVK